MKRRSFCKLGFSISAVCGLPALAEEQSTPDTFDAIVVGAGIAGLTAAALLSEEPALRILLLEKEALIGGSSILSGGQWAVAETEIQQEKQVNDSKRIFFEDMMRVGKNKNDPHLVSAFVENSSQQYSWIRAHDIAPQSLALSAGMSKPRAHIFDPHEIISFLYKKCLNQGVIVKTSTPAVELIVKSDRVEGVLVRQKGLLKYYISKIVLLTSGGFARNDELLKQFVPTLDKLLCFSGRGSSGDGLKMAALLGADLVDMNNIKPSFGFIENARGTKEMTGIFYSGAVAVNQDAERFVNESLPNKEIGQLAQYQSAVYLIFDERIRQLQMATRPNDRLLLSTPNLNKKVFFKGNSFSELATKANLDPKKLERTIASYNYCVLHELADEFNRTTLSGGWGRPVCIDQKPFYIMKVCSGITGTYCGLRVDNHLHVLRKNGTTINGLFAGGEVCGGFHGEGFMAGTAFGKANACGRIAAASILEWLKS